MNNTIISKQDVIKDFLEIKEDINFYKEDDIIKNIEKVFDPRYCNNITLLNNNPNSLILFSIGLCEYSYNCFEHFVNEIYEIDLNNQNSNNYNILTSMIEEYLDNYPRQENLKKGIGLLINKGVDFNQTNLSLFFLEEENYKESYSNNILSKFNYFILSGKEDNWLFDIFKKEVDLGNLNINHKNDMGQSAVIDAALEFDCERTHFYELLLMGADPYQENLFGMNAFDMAKKHNRQNYEALVSEYEKYQIFLEKDQIKKNTCSNIKRKSLSL